MKKVNINDEINKEDKKENYDSLEFYEELNSNSEDNNPKYSEINISENITSLFIRLLEDLLNIKN